MVKIRLRRTGAKKQPHYRVVVADSRAPRDGRFIETIGHYNPRTEPPTVHIDEVRAIYWLERGAQPTEAVARLLTKLGISEKWARVEEVVVAEAEVPRDLSVDELGLPTRLTNILTSAGITTVSELKEVVEKGELSNIPGLGPKSLETIKEALD